MTTLQAAAHAAWPDDFVAPTEPNVDDLFRQLREARDALNTAQVKFDLVLRVNEMLTRERSQTQRKLEMYMARDRVNNLGVTYDAETQEELNAFAMDMRQAIERETGLDLDFAQTHGVPMMSDLVDGGVYFGACRNAHYGRWDAARQVFVLRCDLRDDASEGTINGGDMRPPELAVDGIDYFLPLEKHL